MIKCINCGYFLNCEKADENKTECNKYIKTEIKEIKYGK